MKFTRKIASLLSISGLSFFAMGFLIFPNASILIREFPVNPFVLTGFILLGTGLLQPLSEKMRGRKK